MLGANNPVKSGVDFNSGSVTTFTLSRPMDMFITNGSICDTSGQLLFYSNGDYIANKNHTRLLNSTNFNPTITGDTVNGLNIVQGVLILPYCGLSNKYIMFHENHEDFFAHAMNQSQPTNLWYSVIDMALDGGFGGIDPTSKTVPIIADTLLKGRLTACKNGNGRDWWVVTHRDFSDVYYKVLITPDTITVTSQQIGSQIIYDQVGQAAFSQQGDQYVIRGGGYNFDLFEFDRCDGVFSNYRIVNLIDIINNGQDTLTPTGCAFSPGGRYLYVCNNIYVHQFDTWSANINSTDSIVAIWDSTFSPLATTFFNMNLAPDNKIYITTANGSNVLHVIEHPDSLGMGCNVMQHGLPLPALNAPALPNVPNYGLGAWLGGPCDTITSIANILDMENRFLLYPNPSQGPIQIRMTSIMNSKFQMRLFDALGQLAFESTINQSEMRFDLSFLPDGVYFLEFSNNEFMIRQRWIRQN